MTAESQTEPPIPSRRRLARASLGALVAAVVVLVTAVLPAEYGIDPLGTGRILGLNDLFAAEQSAAPPVMPAPGGPLKPQTPEYRVDNREFGLGPGSSFEFKYVLAEGSAMVFAWEASAPLDFDFHTEPDGKPPEASDSFERGSGTGARGVYVAPYSGIHGWYWENKGQEFVMIKVTTAGFYSGAKMISGGTREDIEVQVPKIDPEVP
jgi:hypothetical protein